jgi:hypothetical protein
MKKRSRTEEELEVAKKKTLSLGQKEAASLYMR